MALITVNLKIVSPYGTNDIPTPVPTGSVTFTPIGHGKYEDALRAVETKIVSIVGGELAHMVDGLPAPLELTPGAWKVLVAPKTGPSWSEMQFLLEEGMPEPVNLAVLAPEATIGVTQLAKGDPGPTITTWEDNGDGTITFIMSDGSRVGPGALPSVGEGGVTGAPGAQGEDGLSAYEVAVADGFVGTEAGWLESLQGAQGEQGADGLDGKSAYQVALDEGFIGSEAEWIASLKGEQGEQGPPGPQGESGTDGQNPVGAVIGEGVTNLWLGTQAAYDILTPDPTTVYIIKEA